MHKLSVWIALALAAPAAQAVSEGTVASRVFAVASPSVVVMGAVDSSGNAVAQGSGVVIGNGIVVSNCHVFEDRRTATATAVYKGKNHPANLRYADVERDLCSFTVTNLAAPPVRMREAANLKIGEDAYAIGAPEGFDLTLSSGIVSSLRKISDGNVVQTTAPISPGSSGGGLFDGAGRLIGITSYYEKEGQQINFALPIEWVRALPQHGKTLQQLSNERRESGNIQEGVKAELAGDYASALATYTSLSEHGDASAQFNLAAMYAQGKGVTENDAEAVVWLSKSAQQGYSPAQYVLGSAYESGQGVPQDYAQAAYWFQKAATQGSFLAQYELGRMYNGGKGVAEDFAVAAYWFRKSAEQGYAKAQTGVGLAYLAGLGVIQDYVTASEWLMIAQANGDTDAMKVLPIAESKMAPNQIAEAQKLASEWWAAHHNQ